MLFLAGLAPAVSAEQASVGEIVRNPSAYRERYLSVRGTLSNPRPAAPGSMAGPGLTVFDLMGNPGVLNVLSVVPPGCPIGSTVTVEGRFHPTAQLRQQFYANVIEATLVSCH